MVLLPLLSYIGLVNVEEVWDKQPTLEVGVVQGVADPGAAQVSLDPKAGQTVPGTKGGGQKCRGNAESGGQSGTER